MEDFNIGVKIRDDGGITVNTIIQHEKNGEFICTRIDTIPTNDSKIKSFSITPEGVEVPGE